MNHLLLKIFFLLFILLPPALSAQPLSPMVDSIPMRDGKKLAVDIHLPSGPGPWPVILIQTPYDRQAYRWGLPLGIGTNIASANYAIVIVDWRGFWGSLSALTFNPNRGEDGYDVVQWVASQSWSDGKIGTWGPSALGKVQYQTARENPPNLVCCVPQVAGSQFSYEEYYPGGCIRKEFVDQLDALGYGLGPFIYDHPTYDIVWQWTEAANMYPDSIRVPMFMIGGWYDHNVDVMLELFDTFRVASDPLVRNEHKMLFGPWVHGGNGAAYVGSANQGQLSYPNAAGWSDSLAMRFFDYYLRNVANGWQNEPSWRYYQLGENSWHSYDPITMDQFWYLDQGNMLTENNPVLQGIDSAGYFYDPKDPSPTTGGATLRQDLDQGPYDQAPLVESRNDILTFTSAAMSSPLSIYGKVRVQLYVSSDQVDTDFAIRLTDVYPDNRSMLITDGIRRMRFRNSYTSYWDTIVPGQKYLVEIEFPATAYTFMPGHKLRIDITSSNYPMFDLNLNNGDSLYVAGDTVTAFNRVYWGSGAPSRVILPYEPSLGFEEADVQHRLELWPNPAANEVYLRMPEGMKAGEIQIFDLHGRMLKQMDVSGDEVRIQTDALAEGIYLIRLSGGWSGKLVVRR